MAQWLNLTMLLLGVKVYLTTPDLAKFQRIQSLSIEQLSH